MSFWPFLKWTKEKQKQKSSETLDDRTRKLTTMHNALNSRDEVDGEYVKRKRGRKLPDVQDCADMAIQVLEEYTKRVKR